ncbi:SRPBCC family protein [Mycobacterium sp. NPDC050551]|uniref:SRPBCC family protein n=1 Tax=Mycobacterium sp. NPDC050551 TaxID=3155407 RepID=UPI003418D1C5
MTNRVGKGVVAVGLLYAARRYLRDWGTTKAEAGGPLPGDELVAAPSLTATEGVTINTSAASVWPWLMQLGQDRGGLYSFEKLENVVGLRYRNADRIHPEWQHLTIGDTVRLAPRGWFGLPAGVVFNVVGLDDQQSIILRDEPSQFLWDAVWSFHVVPRGEDRCRLLIRSRLALRHPGEVLKAEMLGPARAMITRGMLIGIKRRAEGDAQAEASAATASSHLHSAVPTSAGEAAAIVP